MDKDLQEHFFSLLSTKFNRCLEPTLQCKNKAIRAHSIQNAQVLDLLCRDGHVIQLKIHFEKDSLPETRYKPIGRNSATTFTGLCAEHDQVIFNEIDNNEFGIDDQHHLFLLAYRSVYRELYATMDAAVVVQSGYQKRVELGKDPQDQPSNAGIKAVEEMIKSWRTYRYKCLFDYIDSNSEYSKLINHCYTIQTEQPTIAASVLFGMRPYSSHNDIEGVALNIMPIEATRTLVVISYLSEHEKIARARLSYLFQADGQYFNYLISKLLIKHGENFVINPAYYDTWSEDKRSAICDLYSRTLFDDVYDKDSEHFYLF